MTRGYKGEEGGLTDVRGRLGKGDSWVVAVGRESEGGEGRDGERRWEPRDVW